jgi:hypothetical protein
MLVKISKIYLTCLKNAKNKIENVIFEDPSERFDRKVQKDAHVEHPSYIDLKAEIYKNQISFG